MRFDYSAVELFTRVLNGKENLESILEHRAYQTIFRHNQQYSQGMTLQDVHGAIEGMDTPYYGLGNVRENLNRINELVEYLKEHEAKWLATIEEEILRVVPTANLNDLVIYPVLGYDAGIGLCNTVCMNANWEYFLRFPEQFLYIAIHEVFHVVYKQSHTVPEIHTLDTPQKMRSFFHLMLQNEGFATYTPLRLRQQRENFGPPEHHIFADYYILADTNKINGIMKEYNFIENKLNEMEAHGTYSLSEGLDLVFGSSRTTYRVGCELIKRIESNYGLAAVQRAALLTGDDFIDEYGHLLSE